MRKQSGATLLTILFWVFVCLMGVVGVMKILPAHMEYQSVVKVANATVTDASGDLSPEGVKRDFMKRGIIDGVSFAAEDMTVTNTNGKAKISFEYDKRVHLFANVSLIMHFSGETK